MEDIFFGYRGITAVFLFILEDKGFIVRGNESLELCMCALA